MNWPIKDEHGDKWYPAHAWELLVAQATENGILHQQAVAQVAEVARQLKDAQARAEGYKVRAEAAEADRREMVGRIAQLQQRLGER